MHDYNKLIALFRAFGWECSDPDCCRDCQFSGFCDHGFTPDEIADAIEELLAFAHFVAREAIDTGDNDGVSAEILCRNLHKLGLIETDGELWTLPAPPKEVLPNGEV